MAMNICIYLLSDSDDEDDTDNDDNKGCMGQSFSSKTKFKLDRFDEGTAWKLTSIKIQFQAPYF